MNDFIELIKPRKWIFLGLVIVFLGFVFAGLSLENKKNSEVTEALTDLRTDFVKKLKAQDEAEIGLFCDGLSYENFSESFYLILRLPDINLDIRYPTVKYFHEKNFSTSEDIYLSLKEIAGSKEIEVTPEEIQIKSIPMYLFRDIPFNELRMHRVTLNRTNLSVKVGTFSGTYDDPRPWYSLDGQCTQVQREVIYDIVKENNKKITENNIL
jgi:hypothetical protein